MLRITKRFVGSLVPGPKEFQHWDDQLPGLGIRIKPSGVKTYVIRYRTPSGQRRLKFGRHGKLTPEQAYRKRCHANGCGPFVRTGRPE